MVVHRWEDVFNGLGFRRHEKRKSCVRPQRRRRLAFEPLEDRSLLSVCIWTGGGGQLHNNWNNSDNWVNDQQQPVVPQSGDELHFDASSQTVTNNDFPVGTRFQSIDFDASDFTLGGYDLTLTDGISVASDVTGSTISLNVALAGAVTIDVTDTALSIAGNISGPNYLTKTGAGTLVLSGVNCYTGGTVIEDGTLQVGNGAASALCGNGLLVNGQNAALDLNGNNVTVGDVGLIDGSITSSTTPAGITATSYMVLNGSIGVALHGSNAPLMKAAAGAVTLSGTNDYTGLTTVYAGQLTLVGSNAWNPVFNSGGADLQAGKLVFDYTAGGSATDPVVAVRSALAGGTIHSSTAPSFCTIGYDDNNSTGNGVANGVMLEIAVAGDVNLDGAVNGKDLAVVLADWGKTGQTWAQGDVTYDGVVNGKDLAVILANWDQQPTPLPPQVAMIAPLGAQETTADNLQFVVAFSKDVTGVDTGDFSLFYSGTTAQIANVTGYSGSDGAYPVYLVTVDNVYGNGTVQLKLVDNGTITDADGNHLDDTGFIPESEPPTYAGPTYTVSSPFVWTGGGSDSHWSTATNWKDGILPIAGSSVCFEGTGSAIDNLPAETAFQSIEFASSGFSLIGGNALTLTNGITLDPGVTNTTISTPVVLAGPIAIDVSTVDPNEAPLTISGNISGGNSLTKMGPGELLLTGSNSYIGVTTVCGGTVELGPTAQPPVLTGPAGADIQEGSIVFDYTNNPENPYPDPASEILSILAQSYNNGTNPFTPFSSGQIRDTTAAATSTALGWADDTLGEKVTVACTLYGDANLDGTVNLADLSKVLPDWGKTNQTWAQGDFNYDGVVNLGDLTKVLENWGHQLNSSLTASSTFTVDLTDDGVDLPAYGPGTLVVTGAVRLNNATLEVTSSRTDTNYGILRVLIESDSGTPVIGTFNGLPEGAEVNAGGVRYYITYHYNAKTGEFGTGNDVALVSSPAFGVSSALLSSQTVTLDYASESHYLDATLVPRYTCSQFQLSTAVWTQCYPAWANATFSFASEDSAIASVDPSTGLVTFLPQEGEGSVCLTCRILVTAALAGQSPQTIEICLTGASIEDTYYIPDTINGTDTSENNVGNYVLVLYNADSTGGDINNVISSTALMQYYQTYRPGMENANYLGITGVPDTGYSYASGTECQSLVSQVMTWLQAHNSFGQDQSEPVTPIRYIVGLCGLPSRVGSAVDSAGASVSDVIYQAALAVTHGPGYEGGTDRFSLAEYGTPLIAWLDCGSYEATRAYINKEVVTALAAGGLETDGITISASSANIGGNEWLLDDVHHDQQTDGDPDYFPDFYQTLSDDQVAGPIWFNQNDFGVKYPDTQPAITAATDPTAYGSWGIHSGVLRPATTCGDADAWPCSGDQGSAQVVFTFSNAYHIGWWIGMSVESFNGIYGRLQGNPTEFFCSTGFGSTTQTVEIGGKEFDYYTSTPICFVGSTEEPYEEGCEGSAYFDRWAKGWSTLESAWAGQRTDAFVAVTDIGLCP
jgi:autotransporter-associated beta strand protein